MLNFRKRDPELFALGSYEPVGTSGRFRDSVVAYFRRHEKRSALVVIARRALALQPSRDTLTIDPAAWADTRLELGPLGSLRSLLVDEVINVDGPAPLSKVFRSVPVDVYVNADQS